MRSKRGEVLFRSLLLMLLIMTVFALGGCKKKSGGSDEKSEKKTEEKSDDKDDDANDKDDDGEKSGKEKDDEDDDGEKEDVSKDPNVVTSAPTPTEADKPVDAGKTETGNAAKAKEALGKKLNEEYGKFKQEKLDEWTYVIDNVFDPVDAYDYNKEGRAYITRLNSNYNWETFDMAKQFLYAYADLDGDGADELITVARYPGVDWGTSEFTIYKYKDGNVIYMLAPETTEYVYSDTVYPFTFYNGYKYLYLMGYGIDEIDQYFVLTGDRYEKLASMPSDKGSSGTAVTMSRVENLENPLSQREQKLLKETLAKWLVDLAIDDGHMTTSSYNFVNDDIDGDGLEELLVNDGDEIYIYGIRYGSSNLVFYKDMEFEGENGVTYYPDQKVVCLYSEYTGDEGSYRYYSMNEYYYDLSNGYYDAKLLYRAQNETQKKNSSGRYEAYSSSENYFYDGAAITAQKYASLVPRGREWKINAAYLSKQKSQTGTYNSEWIFYDSDSRYLSEYELYGFTKDQCRFARNEIYARRGRKFDTKEVREYFESKSWYRGTIDSGKFDSVVKFNAYESANIKLIEDYEKKMGYTK